MNQTTKQQGIDTRERIYRFLVEFISENSYAPSIKEIGAGVELRSTSSVYYQLMKLKEEGKIKMKHNSPRTIQIVGFEFVRMEDSV